VADPSDAPLPSPPPTSNRTRLPEIDPVREETELREYLGSEYDHQRLVDWEAQLEREAERLGDEQALYRTSQAYLYNLTAFAMTRTKEPYLRDLVQLVHPPARLLDYGCGIGSDGLVLAERGYRVEFADFENPKPDSKTYKLKKCIGQRCRVPLDPAPNDAGQRPWELELGGARNDARNLWPEPGGSPNVKDALENRLHARVCAGEMSLAAVQLAIARDWVSAYHRFIR